MTNSELEINQLDPKAREVLVDLRAFIDCQFDLLDKSGDGYLSREELLIALFEKGRNQRELAFLNFLLVRIREIAASYDEGRDSRPDEISKADLQQYFSNLLADGKS